MVRGKGQKEGEFEGCVCVCVAQAILFFSSRQTHGLTLSRTMHANRLVGAEETMREMSSCPLSHKAMVFYMSHCFSKISSFTEREYFGNQ